MDEGVLTLAHLRRLTNSGTRLNAAARAVLLRDAQTVPTTPDYALVARFNKERSALDYQEESEIVRHISLALWLAVTAYAACPATAALAQAMAYPPSPPGYAGYPASAPGYPAAYAYPAPVYVYPAPVYVYPTPVYVAPPVVYAPPPAIGLSFSFSNGGCCRGGWFHR
jgi:hypothetical protein